MKNTAGRAIQNTNLFYDYVFLFLSGFGNEFQNLQVWSCNITWQSRLFVCLAALGFFSLGQEGFRSAWNVAVRGSSHGPFLLFVPLIYLPHSSGESLIFLLHHLGFSRPPTTLLVAPTCSLPCPSSHFFFFCWFLPE